MHIQLFVVATQLSMFIVLLSTIHYAAHTPSPAKHIEEDL